MFGRRPVSSPVYRTVRAVDGEPELGELIVKAFLMRRSLLLSDGFEGVTIIGSRFSVEAHRLRDFATRNAIPSRGSPSRPPATT